MNYARAIVLSGIRFLGKHVLRDSGCVSCLEYKLSGFNTSGVYWIYPDEKPLGIPVYCDMETDGGGWTLVWSNRYNKPFNKTTGMLWADAVSSEVFSSNELSDNLDDFSVYTGMKLYASIAGDEPEMRLSWKHFNNGNKRDAKFKMTPPKASDNYTLRLSQGVMLEGSGLPGIYTYHNNRRFSAVDNGSNCSNNYGNQPFWYGSCWSGSIMGYNAQDGAYWDSSYDSYRGSGWLWIR